MVITKTIVFYTTWFSIKEFIKKLSFYKKTIFKQNRFIKILTFYTKTIVFYNSFCIYFYRLIQKPPFYTKTSVSKTKTTVFSKKQ